MRKSDNLIYGAVLPGRTISLALRVICSLKRALKLAGEPWAYTKQGALTESANRK